MTADHSPECRATWVHADRSGRAAIAARRADVEAERCYVAYRDAVAAAARSCPACQERA